MELTNRKTDMPTQHQTQPRLSHPRAEPALTDSIGCSFRQALGAIVLGCRHEWADSLSWMPFTQSCSFPVGTRQSFLPHVGRWCANHQWKPRGASHPLVVPTSAATANDHVHFASPSVSRSWFLAFLRRKSVSPMSPSGRRAALTGGQCRR